MTAIMCTLELRKALQGAPSRGTVRTDGAAAPRLGNWAATSVCVGNREMVVALNERTCLTLLFPLRPVQAFRRHFAEALTAALVDHHVRKTLIARECEGLQAARIERLTGETLKSAIDVAHDIVIIETRYSDDLRNVQWNLNQFPHDAVHPVLPSQAVRQVFDVPRRDSIPATRRRPSKDRDASRRRVKARA